MGGVVEGESGFGPGVAFWVGATEVAHLDSDDVVDIRLTREVIRQRREALRRDGRVVLRKSGSADWLEVRCGSGDDVEFVVELITAAARANGGADGEPPRQRPTGAGLERRRRLHRPASP
jgi:hypothetical protein